MADNEFGQELETAVGAASESAGSASGTGAASAVGAAVAAAAGTGAASGVGVSLEVTLDPLSADVGESAEATETVDAEHVPAPAPRLPPFGWFQAQEAAGRVVQQTL
jgi:hypothetical protein